MFSFQGFERPWHENHIIPYNHGSYYACITYWTRFPAYENSVRSPSTKPQCFITAYPVRQHINLLTQRHISPLIQPPAFGVLLSGKRLIWETVEIKKDRFMVSGERLCQSDSGVALETHSCCFASLALSVKAVLVKRKSKKADANTAILNLVLKNF